MYGIQLYTRILIMLHCTRFAHEAKSRVQGHVVSAVDGETDRQYYVAVAVKRGDARGVGRTARAECSQVVRHLDFVLRLSQHLLHSRLLQMPPRQLSSNSYHRSGLDSQNDPFIPC